MNVLVCGGVCSRLFGRLEKGEGKGDDPVFLCLGLVLDIPQNVRKPNNGPRPKSSQHRLDDRWGRNVVLTVHTRSMSEISRRIPPPRDKHTRRVS